MAIDERSRYLISGDSTGDITVWRCDNKGWYQLLRKLRRDGGGGPNNKPPLGANKMMQLQQQQEERSSSLCSGVFSLVIHPDRTRAQMLALSQSTPSLKVFNMATYKPQSVCAGFQSSANSVAAPFIRCQLSADGRFAIASVSATSAGSSSAGSAGSRAAAAAASLSQLKVWDSQTGFLVNASISGLCGSDVW